MEYGNKGRWRQLSPKSIYLDAKYQRDTSLRRAKKIAAEFQWCFFGCVVVSKRKGSFYAIDGGHRLVAACMMDLPQVPCIVFDGMSLQREAEAFVRWNNTPRPSSIQLWQSNLSAEEPNTMGAHKVLVANNFRIGSSTNGDRRVIRSPVVILRLYRFGILHDTLHVMCGCWPDSGVLNSGLVIAGVGRFIRMYRDSKDPIQSGDMMKKIRSWSLEKIVREGMALTTLSGWSREIAVCSILVKLYNKGLRQHQRIEMT